MDCTSLESITIPASVETLGIRAFSGCTSLNSITFAGTTPPVLIQNEVFKRVSATGTYYYPSGSDYSTIANALPSGWIGVAV